MTKCFGSGSAYDQCGSTSLQIIQRREYKIEIQFEIRKEIYALRSSSWSLAEKRGAAVHVCRSLYSEARTWKIITLKIRIFDLYITGRSDPDSHFLNWSDQSLLRIRTALNKTLSIITIIAIFYNYGNL